MVVAVRPLLQARYLVVSDLSSAILLPFIAHTLFAVHLSPLTRSYTCRHLVHTIQL